MEEMHTRKSDRVTGLNATGGQRLIDLSTTGACCIHDTMKEKDWVVTVKINEVLVKARVVYCQRRGEGYRIGVQFRDVGNETQRTIDELVDSYSRGVPVSCMIVD